MKPTLYLYRSCTSCRNAAAVLDDHGVEYEPREYFKEPFTRAELASVLERAGLRPSELVSTRSTVWRSEKMADQDLSEDALFERMLGEPRLVRRPILVSDEGVEIGFKRSRYEELAQALAGHDRV
ncbi:MAG TPA: arsenate reductase family protein [Thermomicrobiales bacterium]|nr:arsenate reductase family protein [Thermomicrobiales bacterium]